MKHTMSRTIPIVTLFCLGGAFTAPAQYKAVNPQVAKIVSEVSEERVAAILKKLEGFRDAQYFLVAGRSGARCGRGS